MSNASLEEFKEFGYLVLRNAIPQSDIAAMREAAAGYFTEGRSHMATRTFVEIPVLASLPFGHRIAELIANVFGKDYVTISQFSMTANLHNPQWHRDSQSQLGHDYLYDPDYLIAKCAVYLQDNDPEWGGGMEIIPQSHRPEFLGYRSSLGPRNPLGKASRFVQRMLLKARSSRLAPVWLPLKAGDALLFHANLMHRASQPATDKPRGGHRNASLLNPPREKFKYLIDWEVAPDNRYVPTYLEHQKSRALKEPGLFRESLEVRYPEDYDPKLVERIRALGLKVVHYSEAERATAEAAS